jgi:uncharacterized alkaline shock family protein YloU
MIRIGEAQVSDQAMTAIVRGAVDLVPGARLDTPGRVSRVLPGRRGPVEWTRAEDALRFDVDIVAARGTVLPALGAEVRESVARHVRAMTGLAVPAVDVTVTGVDREWGPRP